MLCLSGFQLYSHWVPLSSTLKEQTQKDLSNKIAVVVEDQNKRYTQGSFCIEWSPWKWKMCPWKSLKRPWIFCSKRVQTLYPVLWKIQPIREPLVLEKVLKFAQQFSRSGKSLENGDEVWKNGKKRSFFLRQHGNEIFFVLVKSYSISSIHLQHIMEKALFLHFKVYVDHLFDNLKCGKRNYCFGKSLEKVLWVIDPKICMNPGSWIQCVSNMFDMLKSIFVLLHSKVLLAG